jgi:tetratricopeptide (TPR) repeat protein
MIWLSPSQQLASVRFGPSLELKRHARTHFIRRSQANWILHAAFVFVLALGVKLAYLPERLQLPDVDHPTMDSLFHDEWAKGIAFDEWTPDQARLREEPYFRAPLYPYFVSVVYRILGTAPRTLYTIQLFLGALTVVLMFCLCWLVFDRRTAWVAAVLQIGYFPFTYHEAERLIPVLSLLLDLLFLLALTLAGRNGKLRYSAVAGVAAGLSAIARPSILITVPFAAIWLWRRAPSACVRHVAVLGAATVVMILPVTVRNFVRGHDAVLIASQGGVNFFIGNNAQSNGMTAVVPGTRADWWGGFDDTRRIAEQDLDRQLKPSEISRYWYGRGLDFLLGEPIDAGRLYLRKAALFLSNAEVSNERQIYFRRHDSRVLSILAVNFALLIATSIIGGLALYRDRRAVPNYLDQVLPAVFAVPYALGIVMFFVTSRFRLPVAMFLIPLSAIGCVTIFELVRDRVWARAVPYVALGGVAFLLSIWNPFHVGSVADARGQYGLGVDYYRAGDYRKALEALDRSLALDPGYAPGWKMRGSVYDRQGDYSAAIRDLQTACRLDSTMSDAFFRLGVTFQKSGRDDQAERVYLRAVALDPDRIEALNNLADVCLRRGRGDDALPYLQRALSIDSTFASSIYGLGYYFELKGQYDRAAFEYRRAMPYPAARTRLRWIAQGRGVEWAGNIDQATEVPTSGVDVVKQRGQIP